jgi:methyl coenzyme M reductase subunit C-like uncharacterized protein (methanogenesis marker protein 7)
VNANSTLKICTQVARTATSGACPSRASLAALGENRKAAVHLEIALWVASVGKQSYCVAKARETLYTQEKLWTVVAGCPELCFGKQKSHPA